MDKVTAQINESIRQTQNEMICKMAGTIKKLRERNTKLANIAWTYFLLSKMWRGLCGRKEKRI